MGQVRIERSETEITSWHELLEAPALPKAKSGVRHMLSRTSSRSQTMIRSLALAAFAAALSPAVLSAWGLDGHRIVCEIAWQELDQATRSKVLDLLPDEGQFRRFSESCVWADTVARDDPRFTPDTDRHFVNIEMGETLVDLLLRCPGVCVLEAIELYSGLLRGQEVSGRTPREALMFLGHFVGDAHQPLHAGFGSDRGGNGLAIRFFGRDPECEVEDGRRRCRFQLHRLWDSLLVGSLIGEGRTWEEYAQALHAKVTEPERRAWTSCEPLAWANESVEVVVNEIYPFGDGQEVGAEYVAEHGPTVERRLKQAGVRLARLLEESLE
jgi:hypothetical protein